MKKILLAAAGVIFFLFVSVNVASALSPSIAEAIQGLPFGDQLSLLAQKVDEQEGKIEQQDNQIQDLQQELEAEKTKNATLEGQIVSTNQKIEETKQKVDCSKVEELANGLPSGMPAKYIHSPVGGKDAPIENFIEYYKQWSDEIIARGPSDADRAGNWEKPDGSGATVAEMKTAVSYLQNKYNEYLALKQTCGH